MPSFGLRHKVGVAVLTAAMFALSASAASANQAWVWACHGPNGGVVHTNMDQGSEKDAEAVVNCDGADNVGSTLKLNGANPAAGSHAGLNITLPGGVTASKVVISQVAHGSATGARYAVALGGKTLLDQSLDSPATLPTSFDVNASGNLTLSLTLSCGANCTQGAEPASVDVVKVGILVDDTKSPYGISRNANSPVNQSATMYANAVEEGVGFSRAEIVLATAAGETPFFTKTETIGNCTDLTPEDSTLDLPLASDRCENGSVDKAVAMDSSTWGEGIFYWSMRVYDAVGNAVTLRSNGQEYEPFEIWHPSLGSDTQTLSIGSSAIPEAPPQTNPNQNPTTKPGSQAAACSSPRLSVSLGQKPVRVRKSVAVLQYRKRYRFEGRLTCVVNKRRISAPKRTKVELLNKVGKKTVKKSGPRIASKGRFKISLKYPRGSRTLIFRFRNANGQRSQVSIKIKVEKKKTVTKR